MINLNYHRALVTSVLLSVVFVCSCSGGGEKLRAIFYALPESSINQDGEWSHSNGERIYDDETPCIVDRDRMRIFYPVKGPPEAGAENVIWVAYVGEIDEGVAYGRKIAEKDEYNREVAYNSKNDAMYRIPPGTIDMIKKVFEEECMIERTPSRDTIWDRIKIPLRLAGLNSNKNDYNSNGDIHGLDRSVGLRMPASVNIDSPGYNKPFPETSFW